MRPSKIIYGISFLFWFDKVLLKKTDVSKFSNNNRGKVMTKAYTNAIG